jgi:hypothetical protein
MESNMNKLKHKKLPPLPLHKILLFLTLIYFIVFGVFMVHTAGQPDQAPHGYYSRRFSETWRIPDDDPNIRYIIKDSPYLYYWINGAVYKIYNFLTSGDKSISSTFLWRLTSVLMSTGTVFYLYKLTRKITNNPYAGVLAAFFLSNTLMFVFVSGGISYDNLMNLASMAAIFHLVNIYKGEDFVKNTALMGTWLCIAALAKEQSLLLAFIIFLPWVYYIIRNIKNIDLKFTRRNIVPFIIFLIFLALFIELYGVNIIRYGNLTPSCGQIKALKYCQGYSYRYDYYTPINVSWLWSVRDETQNFFQYAFSFWILNMLRSIWGILSHNTFIPMLSISLHGLLVIWSLICIIRLWEKQDQTATILLFILLSYCTYVFFWNYQTELEFSFQHYGNTGRYLLPVIGVFMALSAHFFMKIKSIILKRLTISLAVIIYFAGGMGMFLSRYATVFIHWRIYY